MGGRTKQWSLLVVGLGLWQLAVTLTFAHKALSMYSSDLIVGMLLIILGLLSLAPQRSWCGWAIAGVGLWLQLSPVMFWAPFALTYVNDTLVGVLLMILGFQFYHEPDLQKSKATHCPRGWSFNPSSWCHRIPTVGLALLCWFCARYMAAYQLGYIDQMWDPVFGDGTLNVITSKISKSFPVSDAGLGAVCYTLESVLGWQGSQRRWHTMPWLVLIFGILVVPVGAASITLIILQPVAVGSWCAWCLATAALMLLMIVFTAAELIAVIQFLRQSISEGRSFWGVLWKGAEPFKNPHLIKPVGRATGHLGWGITVPWNLGATAVLGGWIMASQSIFCSTGVLATINFIVGPLLIALSVISMAEVLRSLRLMNIILGVSLLLLPWAWPEPTYAANLNNLVVGCAVLVLSVRKGKIVERYGDWERLIR